LPKDEEIRIRNAFSFTLALIIGASFNTELTTLLSVDQGFILEKNVILHNERISLSGSFPKLWLFKDSPVRLARLSLATPWELEFPEGILRCGEAPGYSKCSAWTRDFERGPHACWAEVGETLSCLVVLFFNDHQLSNSSPPDSDTPLTPVD
jgi:hypothetical protein